MLRTRIAQGYGPVRIEAELRQAGLDREAIAAAIGAAQCDWDELAAAVHARKFAAPAASAVQRNRQYRFLMGRGFAGEQIRHALKHDPDDDTPA